MSELLPQPGNFLAEELPGDCITAAFTLNKIRQYPEHKTCEEFWSQVQQYRKLKLFKKEFIMYHVANEHKGKLSGGRRKKIGILKGVLDYKVEAKGFNGYIEVKSLIGRLSVEQKAFIAQLDQLGISHAVIRSPAEGLEVLKRWMGTNEVR